MKHNPVRDRGYKFALRAIRLATALRRRGEFELARQLLRAATSVGANIEEAQAGISRPDFIAKMAIASKEARESRYWLSLLRDSSLLTPVESQPALAEAEELIRLLTAIVKSSQGRR